VTVEVLLCRKGGATAILRASAEFVMVAAVLTIRDASQYRTSCVKREGART
jgi:hypothetical protein